LEAQVQGDFSYAEGRGRNHRFDQADGDWQSPSSVPSASEVNSSNWACMCVNAPFRSTWGTFAHSSHEGRSGARISRNHAGQIWACDFLQVTDLFFRPLFAFFLIELKSRKVIHVGVTREPSDAWVAQQLREATPYGQAPKYLIRDNDSKFGSCFARVARTSGIKILTTPYHAPRANAICERFLGSVRRECLDHLLIFQEKQLHRVLNSYVAYFNQARPHQGIAQQIPEPSRSALSSRHAGEKVIALPVMGGLHHDYHWAAWNRSMCASIQLVD
jgi:putative transposase